MDADKAEFESEEKVNISIEIFDLVKYQQ